MVNTWSHQRRRRRLQARLKQLGVEEENVTDESESVDVQREMPTARVKEEHGSGDSNEEVPLSVLEKGSTDQSAQQYCSKAELLSQLESLNKPCQLEFTSTIQLVTTKEDLPPQAKRMKWEGSAKGGGGGGGGEDGTLSLSLEWQCGEDRDNLHQILQLVHNRTVDC